MHRSKLASALIDIPPDLFASETTFWAGALGREARVDPRDPDYAEIGEVVPGVNVMIQRVDDAPRVHLDIETDDVEAEVARLEALGARRVVCIESWWVMRDPAGLVFCVVDVKSPETFGALSVAWPDGA